MLPSASFVWRLATTFDPGNFFSQKFVATTTIKKYTGVNWFHDSDKST
jgi:hypothetical protein